ncbi:YjjG family noncanonical pyrimidine nucleotidase [Nonlabens ulvanivorans]|uniref:Haloacid dehalogenase n=1 Tax=Nonlabens ulvanivorans TaxID=906888 RepID=A0A084JZ15_NONUL|nr:YjjG family noncanonical pyrimidine nucleotidase [Nonlabens ulvanivorans]KEZ94199.1 haloacid dehalogenase [Nonlabens ulvanivorans]PRX13189.1 putative hydrolase of the HAD superfamily [Nonlabens ulvanivorans]WOI21717.1 YjjG family noncanonical pyrimidine nucleotidase [Nonlabens ulvanivorans]
MFKNIKHIFFDLDHTLWDFDLNSKLAYQQIFQEHDVKLDLDAFIKVYEPLNLDFWRKFRENLITKEELRYQRLKTAFDACNYPLEDKQIDLFADLYIQYLPNNNHLFPGCIDLLNSLKGKFEMHLITNGFNGVQQNKIDKAGLNDYFNIVLTAEAAGYKKPAPQIFHQAIEMAGASIENSLMIGDSYAADILGAQQVGIKTIWFHTTNQPIPKNEIVVHDLLSIQPLLGL